MKKIIAFVATLAVSLAAFSAYAQEAPKQENVLFKHVSAGVGIGILDGLQVQVSTTLLPNLQARILYTDMFPYVAIGNGIAKSKAGFGIQPFEYNITGINYHERGFEIDEVALNGTTQQRSLSLLADFFPAKNSSFHLTAGVMFSLSPSIVKASGTPKNTSNANPALSEQAAAGNVDIYGITVNPNDGKGHVDVQYALNVVKPYIGIGFGRPCSTKKRVGVNFDLGVAYTGGIHAYSYSYFETPLDKPNKVELNRAWLNSVAEENPDFQDEVDEMDGYLKYLDFANKFPIMPYLRLTVNVAIF